MSENNTKNNNVKNIKLNGLFAFKEGMATVYNEKGESVPVTILKYQNCIVSQIKKQDVDGYSSLQIAFCEKKQKNSNKSEIGHLRMAGIDTGMKYLREIRTDSDVEGISVGDIVSINSLVKGDIVKITSKSKGKGFQGSVRRWNFSGGPATHGSKFHRRPGSSGNRTWPGRVMPGKKFPGHLGNENVTVKNVEIFGVDEQEGVLLVKGPVPGGRNSLVKLVKG